MRTILNLPDALINDLVIETGERNKTRLLYTTRAQKKKPISVREIWANKGFEKIDIEIDNLAGD
jgi:hypothetical protein